MYGCAGHLLAKCRNYKEVLEHEIVFDFISIGFLCVSKSSQAVFPVR